MTRLIDVAKYAQVSINTVSRVINNAQYVAKDKRERVLKAIAELNYVPNESARRLKSYHLKKTVSKQTFNIGCIVFSKMKFSDPYYSLILDGIDREVIRQKYHLNFIYTFEQINNDPTILINMINPEKVDGIIFIHPLNTEDNRKIVEKIKMKFKSIVFVDTLYDENVDCIDVDKFQAGYDAVKYLVGLGHKRIGFIGETESYDDLRYKGYLMGITDFGLEYDKNIIEGKNIGYGIEEGYTCMKRILDRTQLLPTAIFAASDRTAIGVMRAITEKQLKIPDDISVIGFDNLPESQNITPTLTTFGVKKDELGILAVRKLLERIKNPETSPSKTILPVELIIRNSCKTIK